MENTVCHFEIPADDLSALQKFYAALFSWTILVPAGQGEEYLFVRTSQQPEALGGALIKRRSERHGPTIFFTVESVEEKAKKLEELGGTILIPKTALPKLGWVVTALDPQGNALGFFEEDPRAA
jgi:uncharacterized protein